MVTAVVVTYNRCKLLERCLLALRGQSVPVDNVIVVDNASNDGTSDWLNGWLPREFPAAAFIRLKENMGGAGGFAEGLRRAIEDGAHWIWMMDDDAEPHTDALRELMALEPDPENLYGSLAVCGAETSWLTTVLEPRRTVIDQAANMPRYARVQSIPFLGFFVHRSLVERIGLPDAGYFIAADDIEYCIRAERAGARMFIAGRSLIEHPRSDRYQVNMPGRSLVCLRLPPWKRYYDTRNRLLIARKYYGIRLLTQTIPGSFVRLYAALRYEPRRLSQLWAFCCGMLDGLLGRKGKRHLSWGIRQ